MLYRRDRGQPQPVADYDGRHFFDASGMRRLATAEILTGEFLSALAKLLTAGARSGGSATIIYRDLYRDWHRIGFVAIYSVVPRNESSFGGRMSQLGVENAAGNFIAASKVSGTNVFDTSGDKIGSVHDLILDKASGTVEYALLSFGGFLGIGEKFHPIPWEHLDYEPGRNGYVVNLDRSQLEAAPNYGADDLSGWDDARRTNVDHYYGELTDPLDGTDAVNPSTSVPPIRR